MQPLQSLVLFTRGTATTSLLVMVFVASHSTLAAPRKDTSQNGLADLASGVLACSIHPCLGDKEEDVRTVLAERIVSDGLFSYSDLNVAYPQVDGKLQGVVEWDLDRGLLSFVGFKVVNFHASTLAFIQELQEALPGCEMEQDDDEGKEWSCLAHDGSTEILVEVFLAPGLVLLELGN